MSTHPGRLEARISAVERRQTNLETHVEELSADLDGSFKDLFKYLNQSEAAMNARFDKIEQDIAEIKTTMATKEDLAGLATKEELAAMESRILDAFKQLIVVIDSRLPPSK